ncbi:MAG TPA: hypothetical protein VGB77_11140 [Abditibacteriaceae bacterium]
MVEIIRSDMAHSPIINTSLILKLKTQIQREAKLEQNTMKEEFLGVVFILAPDNIENRNGLINTPGGRLSANLRASN